MTSGTPQRARSTEAKQQRERDILEAARVLGTRHGVRAVTLTDVAAEVGLHKSALLRYFETREQIFLALTAEGWQEWSAAVRARLTEMPAHPGAVAGVPADPGAVAEVLAGSLAGRPFFCDLLAQAPLNLERNVSLETAYRFKLVALEQVGLVAADLGRLLGLTGQQARDVVATATSMAGALWQMSAPGTELPALYRAHPELSHAVVEVEPRLARILGALITGMRAAPAPPPAR